MHQGSQEPDPWHASDRERYTRRAAWAGSLPATARIHSEPGSHSSAEPENVPAYYRALLHPPRKRISPANLPDAPGRWPGHRHRYATGGDPRRRRPTTSPPRNSVHRAKNLPPQSHSAAQLPGNRRELRLGPTRPVDRRTETTAERTRSSTRVQR